MKVGFEELEDNSYALLNVVVRVDTSGDSYRTKFQKLFSLIDLGESAPGFRPNLLKDRERSRGALDYLRDRHGEPVIGFFFDQLDSLEKTEEGMRLSGFLMRSSGEGVRNASSPAPVPMRKKSGPICPKVCGFWMDPLSSKLSKSWQIAPGS